MAKKILTTSQINQLLKFKPGWIKDPVPIFRRHLDPASFKQVVQAKNALRKRVQSIVNKRRA